ncbi:MAG: DUF1028 domain-containing protein [Gemmatimonadetes bacterium]|nr:DUF1028 domain-containing protein [Gemmatimonadota bacterium]
MADPVFHTFSIAARDPETGEVGVAVTTRNPCVGNRVPWLRAGVGAVATQAATSTEYGTDILALLAQGVSPEEALRRELATDSLRERRQVGVIAADGRSAQHTGTGTNPWSGHRAGPNYVTQGNLLVGPEVLAAVARSFEGTAGSGRPLLDRLIAAIETGHAVGGDARKGRIQSAAAVVADPRPGRSRRPDGITADVQVCEHPEPVAEIRRQYDAVSETVGYRTLMQFQGRDVWQLKLMLHAAGYFRPGTPELVRDEQADLYTQETVDAVNAFRVAERLSTPETGSPPGLVDRETVARLWQALERAGKAAAVRARQREFMTIR